MKFVGSTFQNVRVRLDDMEYVDCHFKDATLVFGATGSVQLQHCTFENVRFEFVGGAAMTTEFLHGMYHGFGDVGRQLVDQLMAQIRSPVLSQGDAHASQNVPIAPEPSTR